MPSKQPGETQENDRGEILIHYIFRKTQSDELAENKTLPKAHGPKALST